VQKKVSRGGKGQEGERIFIKKSVLKRGGEILLQRVREGESFPLRRGGSIREFFRGEGGGGDFLLEPGLDKGKYIHFWKKKADRNFSWKEREGRIIYS